MPASCACAGMEGREALDLAIKGGARNLGRDDIGEIAPGFAADFVAWDTGAIGFAGAGKDLIAALVLCTPTIGFVDLSVINGRIVVQDGKLTTLDVKVPPSHYVHRTCLLRVTICLDGMATAWPYNVAKFMVGAEAVQLGGGRSMHASKDGVG